MCREYKGVGWKVKKVVKRSNRVAFCGVACIGCMAVTDDCMGILRVMYVQELLGSVYV